MYLCPQEVAILKSQYVIDLRDQYEKKTGEMSPGFNHDDFYDTDEYIEALKKAIETGIPWVWKGDEE